MGLDWIDWQLFLLLSCLVSQLAAWLLLKVLLAPLPHCGKYGYHSSTAEERHENYLATLMFDFLTQELSRRLVSNRYLFVYACVDTYMSDSIYTYVHVMYTYICADPPHQGPQVERVFS